MFRVGPAVHSDVVRERLLAARGFVFDMDGTLVLGDRHHHGLSPLPGALEITRWAERHGRPFVVFTNGTIRTPAHYARTMRDIEFTMPALEAACHAVWDGAELYSCSQTPFFAVDGGRALGTSRAISAMIRSLTGCGLRVVGKPSIDALRSAAARIGAKPEQLAVVGDAPELEVPMAHRGRSLAIAVGTGLGGSASWDGVPVSRRPHLRVRGVDELLAILTEERRRSDEGRRRL